MWAVVVDQSYQKYICQWVFLSLPPWFHEIASILNPLKVKQFMINSKSITINSSLWLSNSINSFSFCIVQKQNWFYWRLEPVPASAPLGLSCPLNFFIILFIYWCVKHKHPDNFFFFFLKNSDVWRVNHQILKSPFCFKRIVDDK